MPIADRRATMDAFRRGEVQVLVATTVIEVGVDVPNATLMVIEGADLFGLAQLHQLRGRVGRGAHESFCVLLADPATDEARRRLDAMARTSDGFELAEVDLELRGEGTVLAAKQSGIPDLRHARLTRHRELAAAGARGRGGTARGRPRPGRRDGGDHRRRHPAHVRRRRGLARPGVNTTGSDPVVFTAAIGLPRCGSWRESGRARGWRRRRGAAPGRRPDRVREALFAILADVSGARVLEPFAGTGALGFEALSRGAASAVFCELDRGRARGAARERRPAPVR